MIRKRRESLGFSQARVAELVGRSASTIRNWERGKSTPADPGDAVALAAVLGLDERQVVEAAGFEMSDVDSHQTVEEAYASLAPRAEGAAPPTTEEDPPSPTPRERERPGEVEEVDEVEEVEEKVEDPPIVNREAEAGWETPRAREHTGTADDPRPSVRPWEREVSGFPSPRTSPRETPARVVPEADPDPDWDERRQVSRAAPPTVLELSQEEPSYLEDPEERQRYRLRSVATAAVVIFLAIVLIWSFDRVTDAMGTMWSDFVGMLEL